MTAKIKIDKIIRSKRRTIALVVSADATLMQSQLKSNFSGLLFSGLLR